MTAALSLPRALGNGLILRRSTPADADALAEFNKMIHRDPGVVEPDEGVAAWTRDLLRGDHPTFAADDFAIVEEQATGKIVSCVNLISQTWSYAGIPFKVGRPELVGTDPAYRKRGLIRAQFDVVHAWSAERGELVQAITGIPYFYRQFGYEMTMALGGGRAAAAALISPLKEGEAEPYRLRPVVEADVAFVMAVDREAARRSLVSCVRDETLWRYELFGKSALNVNRLVWHVIETAAGSPAGVMGVSPMLWGSTFGIQSLEFAPGVSWLAAAPSILRGAYTIGEAMAASEGKTLKKVSFHLGGGHPFYTVARDRLPEERPSYAWYLRVPDLSAFMRLIAPALEERLARSMAVGHTGELALSFYRDGLRLVFEAGRIAAVEPWTPSHNEQGSAGFAGLTFLQLLFGHRSLADLRKVFADCWADNDDARVLLDILFPVQASHFWPLA